MSGRLNYIFKLTCFYNLRLTRKPLDHYLVEIDGAFDRRGLFGKLARLVYQIDLRKKRGEGVSKCSDIKSQGGISAIDPINIGKYS